MPCFRNMGYASATSWLLVLSTRTTGPGALRRYERISLRLRTGWVEAARSVSQDDRDRGRKSSLKRILLLRAMSASEICG